VDAILFSFRRPASLSQTSDTLANLSFVAFIPSKSYRSQAFHRIAEGSYYEAHQQLRVIASRYVKSQNWDAAIDILYEGSLSLLKAGQGGSGGDLGCYLVDVFGKAERGVDAENKGKLLAILRAFPPEEPTKRKFVDEMIAWSAKFGEYPNGEPELHHVAGTLYADGMFLRYSPLQNVCFYVGC